MSVRRMLVVAAVASMLVAHGAGLAFADDLEDYLARAAESDFAGSQVIVSLWDGVSESTVVDIEHAGSRVMLGSADRLIDAGKLMLGSGSALAVAAWNRYATDRYVASEPAKIRRLGRDAESVAILEGDRVRARIVFDVETGAPLSTEIYDGDGRLFRLSTLVRFDPRPRKLYATSPHDDGVYDVMVSGEAEGLPKKAAGYTLADVYLGPDGVPQAFYSDGLFSFSLFQLDGEVEAHQFDDAITFEVDGHRYERLVMPASVWVQWQTDDTTYLLVGDLPPDHLDDVLGDLPEPDSPNLFKRLWRGLFGSAGGAR